MQPIGSALKFQDGACCPALTVGALSPLQRNTIFILARPNEQSPGFPNAMLKYSFDRVDLEETRGYAGDRGFLAMEFRYRCGFVR